MKTSMKAVFFSLAAVTAVAVSGCGSSGGGTTADSGAAPTSAATSSNSPSAASSQAADLYAANCAACHGAMAVSTKKGTTLSRLQNAIAKNTGGMGFLSALSAADQQTIVTGLNPAAATPTPAPTPTPTPTTGVDGAALYAANCAGCHGALATSAKKGATAAQIQVRMYTTPYASRTLTPAEVQAIATALAVAPPTTPPATTLPPVTTVDGASLYAANCAGCHGALAASAKRGATAAQIQVRMDAPPYATRTLTTAEVQAIATALAAAPPTTTTPPPTTPPSTAACGSCHAIPPATGEHDFHTNSEGLACATCHGSGYSTTTVNAATHNNGVKNMATTIGWNATSRSCSNSCHGRKSW